MTCVFAPRGRDLKVTCHTRLLAGSTANHVTFMMVLIVVNFLSVDGQFVSFFNKRIVP